MANPQTGGAQLVAQDGIKLPVSGNVRPAGNIGLSDRGYLQLLDATTGAFTAKLPDPTICVGQPFVFKKTDSSGNAITISQFAAETIDGATSIVLTAQYQTIQMLSDGTNWQVTEGSSELFNALNLTQAVQTGVTPAPILKVTGAANLANIASVESIDVNLALNRTVQFATGALTTQRAVVIQAPTYSAVGASTITTAATLAIAGAPAQGTNATITNAWALLVTAGGVSITGLATYPTLVVTGPVQTTGTTAIVQIAGAVNTGGACPLFTITGAASTAQTLSTEINFVNINLGQSVQWATGALTTQRCVLIQPPTLTAVGASTFTRVATFAISGPPVQGTNVTITKNPYALFIQAGDVCLAGSGSALATNAITGHTWIPSCAGTPTGVVVGETGAAPIIVDTTGNKIWANVLGTWKGVAIA